MPKEEQIILVDENDIQIGAMEKLEAHKKGLLHRAFSILIKNSKGEIMLQKRAIGKYHSGGLWTNTCCSHPRVGEGLATATHRRLKEEMGFDCELKEITTFTYHASLDHGLQENEFLHVYAGEHNDDPIVNPEEADDWKWMSLSKLKKDVAKHPYNYTSWFKIVLKKMEENNIVI